MLPRSCRICGQMHCHANCNNLIQYLHFWPRVSLQLLCRWKNAGLSDFSIPREDSSTLQILLDTFHFQNMDISTPYNCCQQARTYDQSISSSQSEHVPVHGADEVCECCDSGCENIRMRRGISRRATEDTRSLILGPVIIRATVQGSETMDGRTMEQCEHSATRSFSGHVFKVRFR
ncbi:hypothetical protein J4Q44_G00103000 [Coregonus suidteri]|uniref:Uncharacterized protein n=1 Tax=Coregonus suidteri TaxID=861788 RepID=A0AAN8M083_9TELE